MRTRRRLLQARPSDPAGAAGHERLALPPVDPRASAGGSLVAEDQRRAPSSTLADLEVSGRPARLARIARARKRRPALRPPAACATELERRPCSAPDRRDPPGDRARPGGWRGPWLATQPRVRARRAALPGACREGQGSPTEDRGRGGQRPWPGHHAAGDYRSLRGRLGTSGPPVAPGASLEQPSPSRRPSRS